MIDDFFCQSCNITLENSAQDPADDQDARGGVVNEPHAAVQAGVPCLYRDMGGDNAAKDGKAAMTKVGRLYLNPEDLTIPALTTQHRVELLVPGSGPRELVVMAVVEVNSMGRLLQVDCAEQAV